MNTMYFSEKDREKFALKNGDILLCEGGEVGRCAIWRAQRENVFYQKALHRLRSNGAIIPEFFQAYIEKVSGTKVLDDLTTRTSIAHLTREKLVELVIKLPPILEQKKIATVLSTWDEAIATTKQLLASSERQKKALMQQLLTGKKRLAGFEGEWPFVTMGQIFRRVTTRNEGQSTNVVTMSGQQGLIRQQEFFKKSVASETLDAYFLLKKGQFAYNKSYSNGYPMGAIKRLNRYEKAVVTTLYICFEIENEDVSDSDYFEHFFEAGLLNHGLSKVANEGGRAHGLLNVKPSDFFSLQVPLPKLKEQEAIARVITAAEEDIQRFKLDLELLKEEKRALMQQLLTGKRRVKVPEAEPATA